MSSPHPASLESDLQSLRQYASARGANSQEQVEYERQREEVISRLAAYGPEAVPQLCQALPDPYLRRGLADVLGRIGDARAVAPLIEVLVDPYCRCSVIVALGAIGDAQALPPLCSWLEGPDPSARLAAAAALGALRDPEAIPCLVRALEEPGLRAAAARSLGQLGNPEVAANLMPLLHDPDIAVRAAVYEALGQLRAPEVIVPLCEMLATDQGRAAARALVSIGTPAVEPLLEFLGRTADSGALRHAVEALGDLGDLRAVEPLCRLLSDQVSELPEVIAAALGKLRDSRAVEPLGWLLADSRSEVRGAAVHALANLGPAAVGSLRWAVSDPDQEIGITAFQALAILPAPLLTAQPLLASAVPNLAAFVDRLLAGYRYVPSEETVAWLSTAVWFLGCTQSEAAISPLKKVLLKAAWSGSQVNATGRAAAEALLTLGEPGLTALLEVPERIGPELRERVVAALPLDDSRVVTILNRWLAGEDAELAGTAARKFRDCPRIEALPNLKSRLQLETRKRDPGQAALRANLEEAIRRAEALATLPRAHYHEPPPPKDLPGPSSRSDW